MAKAKTTGSKTAGTRTSKTPSRTTAAKKSATSSKTKSVKSVSTTQPTLAGADSRGIISAEDRRRMIQDAAYHLAEKDGFQHGREQEYWLRAEKQVDQLIQAHNVMGTGNQQIDAVDLSH